MKGTTRIKILSVVFVALCIVAYFSLQKKWTTDTISKEDTEVAVADTASIQKITILKEGQTQTLTKSENGNWKINNKFDVRTNVMNLLLTGLHLLEIKRPVSEDLKLKAKGVLGQKGTKVNVYFGDQQKSLVFASNENDPNTTLLMTTQSETPYVAYVPGVPGDINNIFKLKEHEWRSRVLFNSNPNSIQKLSVRYTKDPLSSFEIQFREGGYSVKDVARLDTAKLENYLSIYQFVPLAGFIPETDDSTWNTAASSPFALIELEDINQRKSNTVALYGLSRDKKNYLGELSAGKEKVILNKEVFDRLLLEHPYFEKK